LERLPPLTKLRHLMGAELKEQHFEIICTASQVTHLELNVRPVKSLAPLSGLSNVKVLSLYENTKLTSLAGVESLQNLQILSLANFAVAVSLEPLASCKSLRSLWLSGTTWTAMRVPSLLPLAGLANLERLMLPSVRVKDRKLAPLHSLTKLAETKLPNFFPASEFAALAAAVPGARGKWLELHASKA
jgi:Leucine-rich repeat (LRR) protein